MTTVESSARRVPDARTILALALPALGVLAAEPLYVLLDTAVVGRLGALPLAALAAGGLILTTVSTQLTFLSYGTTARAARWHGDGQTGAAVREGVQATWLALGVGVLIAAVVHTAMDPLVRVLTGGGDLGAATAEWTTVATWGVPFILLSMAGNGWMRGVQDTVRPLWFTVAGIGTAAVLTPMLVHGLGPAPALGLVGSAWANLVGQLLSGVLFLVTLLRHARRHDVSLTPRLDIMGQQLVLARDLIVRSLGFQLSFLSAGAVAARLGAGSLAAHQISWQMWNFSSLVLDALAIAAQALVGARLGASDIDGARQTSRIVLRWSTISAVILGATYAALTVPLPRLFTSDPAVLDHIGVPWTALVVLLPVAGLVFALDGVLLGAGDAAFLRTATVLSAFGAFLPLIWIGWALSWGLAGIWVGLGAFMLCRCACGVYRWRSGRWEVSGAPQ